MDTAQENCNCDVDMDRIVQQYATPMLRICFMYLKDMSLAEDAMQDTMLKIYKNYDKFDGSNEKTWIMRIAMNVCKDYLRSAWMRKVNVVEELNDVPDIEKKPNEDDTLIKAVMQLKPKYKEVIILFYYQDMKISEIAKAINSPEATVSVRLKRARDQLKNVLGGWYYDEQKL